MYRIPHYAQFKALPGKMGWGTLACILADRDRNNICAVSIINQNHADRAQIGGGQRVKKKSAQTMNTSPSFRQKKICGDCTTLYFQLE